MSALNDYGQYYLEAIEMGVKNPLGYTEWKEFENEIQTARSIGNRSKSKPSI